MRTLASLIVGFGIVVALAGCSLLPDESAPTVSDHSLDPMGLEGTWIAYFNKEASFGTQYSARIEIDREECGQFSCEVSGIIKLSFQDFTEDRFPLEGRSYPQDGVVRLVYRRQDLSHNNLEIAIDLDRKVGSPAPANTLAGYFVTFNNDAAGHGFPHENVFDASGRGKASFAGRIVMWPEH